MSNQTILVRLLNADLPLDDPLVRIVTLHVEAGGTKVVNVATKKGTRRDVGYVVVEVDVDAANDSTLAEEATSIAKYIRGRAATRGLAAVRVEVETLEVAGGAK